MSYSAPSTFLNSLKSTEGIGQGAIRGEPRWQSPHTASIHMIDNDSLLNILFLHRPAILDGNEDDNDRIFGGRIWVRERWWYRLAQVCQRWRNLILQSPSYLSICLVCTNGTPVADMLARSPPLPLVIDYNEGFSVEEEGIILALEQRDRVRRIRLQVPVPNMQRLIMAIDEEYPVLEHLIMVPSTEDKSTALVLPETLQAPHLRHLSLRGFDLRKGSRLLTTSLGIVTLCLYMEHPYAYFQPNTLLRWISSMPHLKTLQVEFLFPIPNRDVERQPIHTPIVTDITLPNLRLFAFRGVGAYLEAVVRRIAAPHLERLVIQFYKQLTYSVPRLLRFMNTAENLRFSSAKFKFSTDDVHVKLYSRMEIGMDAVSMVVRCWHLDWQVSSVAQIFNSLSHIFSTVNHLTLEHEVHGRSSEDHNEVDRAEWRNLLRSFSNVKTLRFDDRLVKELSRCLRLDDGELPLGLLPELQELTYSGSRDIGDVFTSFIDARQNAGRTVTLVRPSRLLTNSPLQNRYLSITVDGYISFGFPRQHAERYFFHLLKRGDIPAMRLSGQGGVFFVVPSVPHHIQNQTPHQTAWILDRMVVSVGTVVPQRLWIPHTTTGIRQHVAEAELQMPIFFQHTNGNLGLSLEAAMNGRSHTLINVQRFAPLGPRVKTYIRIGWPGYQDFRRQVQIRNETADRNPVSLGKFVQHVGQSVDAFLRTCQPDNWNPAPKWFIGQGGIRPNEIMIIGAIHVSSGSWMPILQLTRYIF